MHELPALRYMHASNKGVAKIVIGFVAKGVEKTLDETSRRYKNETGQDYVVPDYFKQRMQKNFYAIQDPLETVHVDETVVLVLNCPEELLCAKAGVADNNKAETAPLNKTCFII